MILEIVERLSKERDKLIKLRVAITVDSSNLFDVGQQLGTVISNVAMVNLQNIVDKQIGRPLGKWDSCLALRETFAERSNHTLDLDARHSTGLGERDATTATEVYSEVLEDASCCKVIADDRAYAPKD